MLPYPSSSLSVLNNQTSSYLKRAWKVKVKFHVGPSWEGGTKICINDPGHMIKMAVTPIHGKNLKISKTRRPVILKLGMQHRRLEPYKVCKNVPGLTLTYFSTWSNLVAHVFEWEKTQSLNGENCGVLCTLERETSIKCSL